MKLIDDLIDASDASDFPIKDCRVGISWTGVWGNTVEWPIPKVFHLSMEIIRGDIYIRKHVNLLSTPNPGTLLRLGVAAINSMIKPQGKKNINALDIIMENGENKNITMVGKFPKTNEIREISKNLWILEFNPSLMDPKKME